MQGKPMWPLNEDMSWPEGTETDWNIHLDYSRLARITVDQNAYDSNYTNETYAITRNGRDVTDDEPFKSAKFFMNFAWAGYSNVSDIKRMLADVAPGWTL